MKPSRAMIPGEILCALFGLMLAYFGGISDSPIGHIFTARHESILWFLLLGAPALWTLWAGAREWFLGSAWNLAYREISCKQRGRAVLVQGLCWLYAVYVGAHHENGTMLAAFGVV